MTEKYSSLDKKCQKGAKSASKVIVLEEIAKLYKKIMNDSEVKKRFEQASILLMEAGFV